LKLHIGSSTVRVEGFLNVDVRSVDGVDVVAHAGHLDGIADGSVAVLFANAFIEHVFVGQQVSVLREWRRVLSPDGLLIVLGIPDFKTIAELYLRAAPGIIGDRFDLFNVYRYTHGDPEQAGVLAEPQTWSNWDPGAAADSAPPGWLPQLHKGLYDAGYVHELFVAAGYSATTFAYAWGEEQALLNLGVIASPNRGHHHQADNVLRVLREQVPGVDRFLRPNSIRTVGADDAPGTHDGMLDHARRLTSGPEELAPSTPYSGKPSAVRRLLARRKR
jgi:hypothetical protein